ncbi:MAG: response regulator [Deltaproteobacteria bacterium]|nr:MAG: response regulator [Deltaproteobacteria bacterium]
MGVDNLSVMIVDDEEDFLETLVKRLEKRDVKVIGAKSGEEALELLQESPVDVVVLDVKMPGMDGIQALKEIRRRHPLVEVVLLTGHASTEVAIKGMELGAFDYLMKPIGMDELLYKVQDAYERVSIKKQKIKRMEGVMNTDG